MKYKTIEQIIQILSEELIDNTSIHCGHYLIEEREDRTINYFIPDLSLDSFRVGTQLYKESKNRGFEGVKLTLLVNDLAINNSAKREKIRENYTLPNEYKNLLDTFAIDKSEIEIVFESRLRNRADKQLKKGLKKGTILNYENQLVLNPVLTRGSGDAVSNKTRGKKQVPNCRMMLAQELLDRQVRGYKKAINICNQELYECKGRYAIIYHTFLKGSMDVINTYLIEKKGNKIISITEVFN